MIVMKFGGSSVESASAIMRVASSVGSHLRRQPVVVVSAMGKTTDRLLEMADEAAKRHDDAAEALLCKLETFHFGETEKLVQDQPLEALKASLRKKFSELRVALDVLACSAGGLTPALKDNVSSYGEQLSSLIVAAAFTHRGIESQHLDARSLIVTDGEHTRAAPLFPETNRRLRNAIVGAGKVVVTGGFIAATEQGITTTLGRGGSDLTASIVGAAIDASEIQIWTDVDGMLTCDPRLFADAYLLKTISYLEAAEMARWGAKVLHPDTVQPAIEKQIPIVIRNSRRPEVQGTTIVCNAPSCPNPVKSIAVKTNLTLLEIRSCSAESAPQSVHQLSSPAAARKISAELVWKTGETLYVGIKPGDRYLDLRLDLEGCVEAHLLNDRAVISLVGDEPSPRVIHRTAMLLKRIDAKIMLPDCSPHTITIVVPQRDLTRSLALLHGEFFQESTSELFPEPELATT
jgi:aspartate kinase